MRAKNLIKICLILGQLFLSLNTFAQISKHSLNTDLEEVLMIVDQRTGKEIGGFYPLKPFPDMYVTALHVLNGGKVMNGDLARDSKIFTFRQKITNVLLDVAILARDVKDVQNFIEYVKHSGRLDSMEMYANHLNYVDGTSELTITKSLATFNSNSRDYFFFQNTNTSFVGPVSSGALTHSAENNFPVGSIICLSTIQSNQAVPIIRVLKFSALNDAHIEVVEIPESWSPEFSREVSGSFTFLKCDKYNGRRGGGD